MGGGSRRSRQLGVECECTSFGDALLLHIVLHTRTQSSLSRVETKTEPCELKKCKLGKGEKNAARAVSHCVTDKFPVIRQTGGGGISGS